MTALIPSIRTSTPGRRGVAAYRLQLGSADFRFIAELAVRYGGFGRVVDSALDADVFVVDKVHEAARVRDAFAHARIVVWSEHREIELAAVHAGADAFACMLDGITALEAVL